MTAQTSDTICAIATPTGRGGIGIVRVSGPGAADMARAVLGVMPQPRRARYGSFRDADGAVLDQGLALFFRAPHSYTGEDVLELHGHGGPVLLDMLVRRCVELGARLAQPGEFSRRAFLNDRLDLAQAEAVADLIDSATEQAARAAARSLSGVFSQRVHVLVEGLTQLRMHVEAAMDFPDEDEDFLADAGIATALARLGAQLQALLADAGQGRLLRDGLTLVLAGWPNAGKSSLLNALAGYEAAIVTEIAGTTRDLVREQLNLDGMPLHIVDTAGLSDSDDPVEREGVRRALAQMQAADHVLLVVDHAAPEPGARPSGLPERVPLTTVYNKIDLTGHAPELSPDGKCIYLSAKTGAGMEDLHALLKRVAGLTAAGEHVLLARRRHLDALERARAALSRGYDVLERHRAGELLAEELRQAQRALGEITGEVSSEDLLGRIFSSFCMGK